MIAIGCDHVGLDYKTRIMEHLVKNGYEVKDYGTYTDEQTDYPVYGRYVAESVARGECEKGILICGTGVGISIAANKVDGIRAVVCSEPYTAVASRRHNDTNILAFGARVVGFNAALMIVDCWLDTGFDGGRHQNRIDMISEMEK